MKTDLLIVGGGSRALLLLERLAAAAAAAPERALKVVVADPGVFGRGLHVEDQRPYITFNTPFTCPTVFFNERIPGLAPAVRGLSFEEWLRANGGEMSRRFQPRAVVGRYLAWSARHLLENLPPNLAVEHVRVCVKRVAPTVDGRLNFETDGSTTISARAAVIAVGHSFSKAGSEGARIIDNPFPTHVRLKGLDGRHRVAVRGMGLTALDVVAELTSGRGGRFEGGEDGAPPRYVASGDEPKITLYSRSSCPVRSRPLDSDEGGLPFTPAILTEERAAQMLGGQEPIAFRTAVFPMILAEMASRLTTGPVPGLAPEPLARIRDWFARGGAARSDAEICAFFMSPEIDGPLFELIRPVLREGVPTTRERAIAFLRDDIRESRLGISGSSLKYALEALIEARVFVKKMVDFRPDAFSDRPWIFGSFAQLVNRNTIGPQPERSAEILSLVESGLVEIAPAGSSVQVREDGLVLNGVPLDTLVRADHLRYATPTQGAFIQSLISSGLSLPVLDAGGAVVGLEVDQGMRLAARDAGGGCRLWATGPICDGSAYYNNYVPCIQPDAEYPYREADRIARDVLEFFR